MSTPRTRQLSSAICHFRIAVEGLDAPDDVNVIMNAVNAALFSDRPIADLNRSIGQIRRQRPNAIASLAAWLRSSTVIERAGSSGCHWAWVKWCLACKRLAADDKAHVAFEMDSPGRPTGNTFTAYENAAIHAESLSNHGAGKKITSSVLTSEKGTALDRREVQRQRKALRNKGYEVSQLHEQAQLINLKRGKS